MAKLAFRFLLILYTFAAISCENDDACVSAYVSFEPAGEDKYTLIVTIGDESWTLQHQEWSDVYEDIGGFTFELRSDHFTASNRGYRDDVQRDLDLSFLGTNYSGHLHLRLSYGEVETWGTCSAEPVHVWFLERNANTTN